MSWKTCQNTSNILMISANWIQKHCALILFELSKKQTLPKDRDSLSEVLGDVAQLNQITSRQNKEQ